MPTYAIGDIHGQLALLRDAHARIAADRARLGDGAGAGGQIVHIGDLVDRGPDSRGVVDCLMQGIARGEDWVVLKGNHDRMFAGYLADPQYHDPGLSTEIGWLSQPLGGLATLASYGVRAGAGRRKSETHADTHAEALEKVPAAHAAFLTGLPLYHLAGEALFVHAGIRPGVDLRYQTEDDLVWIRNGFLEDRRDHGALIVHGHTAIAEPEHLGNRLNIDSGAAYGGPLTAVVIEGRSVWLVTDTGRVPLPPPPG